MAATRLLLGGVVLLSMLLCVVSADQNTTITDSSNITVRSTGRKDKKVDSMVSDMYTAFMMTKNMMSMMLMFVSPIIQIKGFGLSVLNTLINIGRFLLQMQSTKRLQEMAEMHHANMNAQGYHADHHHMGPLPHHKGYEGPQQDHDSPVYIVKDQGDSWGDDNNHDSDHHHPSTNEHDIIWAKEPDNHWKSAEHFSVPNHDQKWSSSQKFGYYALPPAMPFSSRLGEPPPVPASPQHSLPPAHASYVSGGILKQLYPHFSPNITRFR